MDTWLIDTALFKSLAPGGPKRSHPPKLDRELHEDPLFLSAAFLVELKAVIDKIRGREAKRAEALQAWFDGTCYLQRQNPSDRHPRRSSGGQPLALSPGGPPPRSLLRRGSRCDGANPWPRPPDQESLRHRRLNARQSGVPLSEPGWSGRHPNKAPDWKDART